MYRLLCLSLLCSACVAEDVSETTYKKSPPVGDQDDDTDEGTDEAAPEPDPDPDPPVPEPCDCSWDNVELDVLLDVDDCAAWVTDLRGAAVAVSDVAASVGPLSGTVTGDRLDLVYEHDHWFIDGCRWRATERLTGGVAECSLELEYSYSERAVSGTYCALPCSGRGWVWAAAL